MQKVETIKMKKTKKERNEMLQGVDLLKKKLNDHPLMLTLGKCESSYLHYSRECWHFGHRF